MRFLFNRMLLSLRIFIIWVLELHTPVHSFINHGLVLAIVDPVMGVSVRLIVVGLLHRAEVQPLYLLLGLPVILSNAMYVFHHLWVLVLCKTVIIEWGLVLATKLRLQVTLHVVLIRYIWMAIHCQGRCTSFIVILGWSWGLWLYDVYVRIVLTNIEEVSPMFIRKLDCACQNVLWTSLRK